MWPVVGRRYPVVTFGENWVAFNGGQKISYGLTERLAKEIDVRGLVTQVVAAVQDGSETRSDPQTTAVRV